MSKKFKKHRRGRGFPWPLFLFGGLALIAAAVVYGGKGGEDSGGTPKIAVDEQRIDYGVVRFGETRAFRIKVSNTGDGTLRFQEKPNVEVLEGC
jgi:hypothetical protein